MSRSAHMYGYLLIWSMLVMSSQITWNDAARPWQLSFQDPATPVMENLIVLHHHIFFYVVGIVVFVSYLLVRTVLLFKVDVVSPKRPINFAHGTVIEILWTIAPTIILVLIAIPSFSILYGMDDVIDPTLTIKAIGHQWYWSYEYSDYTTTTGQSLSFDSYIINEEDLQLGQLRLLETDNHLVLPTDTHICIVVTSADVLHSWAVPSLGIKMDAVPGRLNQIATFLQREGIYYGQCSEICGVNHGFMPIVVEAVPVDTYVSWISKKLNLV